MTTETKPATWLDRAHDAKHQLAAAASALESLASDLAAVGLDRPAKRACSIADSLIEARVRGGEHRRWRSGCGSARHCAGAPHQGGMTTSETTTNTTPNPDDDLLSLGLQVIMRRAHDNATAKGFWETERCFAESIALMHSELSEALEGDRAGDPPSDKIPGFTSREEELADAVIRICDVSAHHGLRLDAAIKAKMAYNASRPRKHGKRY